MTHYNISDDKKLVEKVSNMTWDTGIQYLVETIPNDLQLGQAVRYFVNKQKTEDVRRYFQ